MNNSHEVPKITTIEDMFRWKLSYKACKIVDIEPINCKSVEDENKELCAKLKWGESTDVLYSFLLTYKLGLESVNKERFYEIKKELMDELNLDRINDNWPVLIYKCSHDPAFAELNDSDEWNAFISLYFTIGNVIPVWPGGNTDRGLKGIYDIPEIYFAKNEHWAKALVKKYHNAHMDGIIGDRAKEYSSRDCIDKMKADKERYYEYLSHRNEVIKKRNEELGKELEKISRGIKDHEYISSFCTCTDLECPCHPTNHDKGCSPCIAKNLQQGEIPSCFFKKVNPDEKHEAYFFKDFAESVMRNR